MNREHYYLKDIRDRRNKRDPIKPMVHPFDGWLERAGHYFYWGVMLLAFVVVCLSMAGVIA